MRDELTAGTRIQCALDAQGAAAALPSREDDRHRRPRRLRRRHRPDRASTATASTAPRIRARARSAGTTRGPASKGPRSPTSPSTSGMRWREVTGETPARSRAARRRPATSSCRSCARSPRRSTTRVPRGDFRILESYVRALRSAQRAHLPREPVSLVARDRARAPRQARRSPDDRLPAARRPSGETEHRQRRHPRHARRAHRGRRGRRAPARLHALRAPRAAASTPSTCTPRSASSTTAG